MKELPSTSHTLLLRTDFSNDRAWERLCNAVKEPSEEGFLASFDCINNSSYERITVEDLVGAANKNNYQHSFICVADRITLTDLEQPILVIDLYDQPGQTFRAVPSEAWSVENNLSICNLDFQDFLDSCDSDGVFRGF